MLHARLLTYIDEVVRQGSIRKAAERLNVASSAISRQILALEQSLGVALFDRSGRRLKATAAGEVLVRHVRETLRGMNVARAQIDELKGLRSGLIKIGLMSGLAANFLPRAVTEFQEKHPRVEVRLSLLGTGEQILTSVEKGDIDLGIGFDFPRHPHIRVALSAAGQLGAVLAPDHPLTSKQDLRLIDCIAYPLALADSTTAIRPHIDEAFGSMPRPRTILETNSIEVMRQMAMAGKTVTFLTPFDIEAERRVGRLVYIPVREFARHEQHLMLIQNDRRSDALPSLLAEQLKSLISEVVDEYSLVCN
jgi:DNA-binding transcriptional LysR family regulator